MGGARGRSWRRAIVASSLVAVVLIGAVLVTVETSGQRADVPPQTSGVRSVAPAAPRPAKARARPSTAPVETIAAFIDRMAPLARRGDADAAYRVYRAEALCGSIDREQRWIRESAASDVAAMDAMKARTAALVVDCAGVTPAQAAERFGFLDQAIRAGNRDAMLAYRNEGGPLGRDIETFDANDPRLIAWQRNANAYLESLAAKGDRDAWVFLAADYTSESKGVRDDAAAVKYKTALVVSAHPERDPMSLPGIAELARRMSPDALQQAVDEGRALAARFPKQP